MSGIPRGLLQTFAQTGPQAGPADVQTFGRPTEEHLRNLRPPPDPPGAVEILRRGADGAAEFWTDAEGRTCGGPNGPIASTLPPWPDPATPVVAARKRREP